MIGEFEKLSKISAKHVRNGTKGQLDRNLIVLASKKVRFTTDLEAMMDELQSSKVDQNKSLDFCSESREMKEATAKCQEALRDITKENDDAFIEISKLRRSPENRKFIIHTFQLLPFIDVEKRFKEYHLIADISSFVFGAFCPGVGR